jgi:hypothetical protein
LDCGETALFVDSLRRDGTHSEEDKEAVLAAIDSRNTVLELAVVLFDERLLLNESAMLRVLCVAQPLGDPRPGSPLSI